MGHVTCSFFHMLTSFPIDPLQFLFCFLFLELDLLLIVALCSYIAGNRMLRFLLVIFLTHYCVEFKLQ